MKVSAKTTKNPTPVEVDYDFGDTLEQMVENFGKDVVEAHAKGALVITLQAFMRRHIDKGTSADKIQDEVAGWKPDVRSAVKLSAVEKASAQLTKLSPQERADLLARLQAMQ